MDRHREGQNPPRKSSGAIGLKGLIIFKNAATSSTSISTPHAASDGGKTNAPLLSTGLKSKPEWLSNLLDSVSRGDRLSHRKMYKVERAEVWRSTSMVVLLLISFALLRPCCIFTFDLYVSANHDGCGSRHFVLAWSHGCQQLLESNEFRG
nr:uncharacterized protein LOC113738497 [Coffea arabica]